MRVFNPTDLGALAREARGRAGWTQHELGRRVGASRFWVADFERGKPGVELRLVFRALQALGLAVIVEPAVAQAAAPEGRGRMGAAKRSPRPTPPAIDLGALIDAAARPALPSPGTVGAAKRASRRTARPGP